MSDWWGVPASDSQSGSGLAGFFTGDSGADVGERLGMIGEILSRTGSGQGLAGIGGQIGAMNERSSTRRARTKQTQMAYRLADKLQSSNPDLAEVIRANPAFGLELIGKKMMAKEESAAKIAEYKALTPFEIKRAKEIALAQGDVERANKIAEIEAEAKADADRRNNSPLGKLLNDIASRSGGGGNAPVTPPVATPDVTAKPNISSAVSGLSAGSGTEPPAPGTGAGTLDVAGGGAGTGAGQASVAANPSQATAVSPAPSPTMGDDPMAELVLAPGVIGEFQKELTRTWQVPVEATDVMALLDAQSRKDGTAETIYNNMQTRYKLLKEQRAARAFEKQKIIDANAWDLTGKRTARRAMLDSELGPIQPSVGVGPMPRGSAQQGIDPRAWEILQNAGFADPYKAFGQEGVAPAARQVEEETVNTGSGAAAIERLQTRSDKLATDQAAASTLKTQDREFKDLVAPIKADPNTPASDRAILTAMETQTLPKDRAQLMATLTKQTQEQILAREKYENIDLKKEKREAAAAEAVTAENKNKEDLRKRRSAARNVSFANDIVAALELANSEGNAFDPVGPYARGTQWLPTTAAALAESLDNLQSRVGLEELSIGRQINKAGGSDVGNPTQVEGERLGGMYGEVTTAQFKDKATFNKKLKTLYNMKLDVEYGVGVGPDRMIVDGTKDPVFVSPEEAIPTYREKADELRQDQAETLGTSEVTLEDIEKEILDRRARATKGGAR